MLDPKSLESRTAVGVDRIAADSGRCAKHLQSLSSALDSTTDHALIQPQEAIFFRLPGLITDMKPKLEFPQHLTNPVTTANANVLASTHGSWPRTFCLKTEASNSTCSFCVRCNQITVYNSAVWHLHSCKLLVRYGLPNSKQIIAARSPKSDISLRFTVGLAKSLQLAELLPPPSALLCCFLRAGGGQPFNELN